MDNEIQIEVERLLAGVPAVQNSCDLDLLVFLHRHPRTLLTNEQIARFIGYGMKQVARTIDALVAARILEPAIQSPTHAARLYILVLDGPNGGGIRELLKTASTWQGRSRILDALHRRVAVESGGTHNTQQEKASHHPNIVELRRPQSAERTKAAGGS